MTRQTRKKPILSDTSLSTIAQASWLRWLLVAALVLLYAGWIGYVVIRDKPVDFYTYYIAAYGFHRGKDIYQVTPGFKGATRTLWAELAQELRITNYAIPYLYPPLAAELIWPLTLLPPRWAALVWLVGTGLAFAASAWLLGRSSKSSFGTVLALGLLLFFIPPLTTLHAGQVNGLVLLALTFALYACTRRRPAWTGLGIAIGAMLKLVPILYLGYLGWRRRWRAVLMGLAGIALLFCLAIPLIRWSGVVSYAHSFTSLSRASGLFPIGANQGISGFFARLLTASSKRWYLADSPQLARALWLGTSLSLAVATAALCWPTGDFYDHLGLEFALITTAISLPTPYVWYHQLAWLLIPFFVLTEHALIQPSLRWMLVPLAVGYVLTDIHGLAWHYLESNPLLVSMPLYTTLLLWGLLAWLIVRKKYGKVFRTANS